MRCEPRPGSYAPRSPLAAELILKGFFFSLFANVRGRFTPNVGGSHLPERATDTGQMSRMMMTIDALKRLHGHSQVAGCSPDVRPALHEPRRRRVSKRVRRHNTFKAGVLHNLREYFIDPSDRAAFPFHNVTRSHAFPAPQMRQKLRRQWRRRSALIR